MPKLTAKQVQTDIMNLLKGSVLADAVSGSVYRSGLRPRDSRLEDITVTFTEGSPDQLETGTVTVNVFVPDLADSDGTPVEDMARTAELEALAQEWFESLGTATDYLFALGQTIYTEAEPDTKEHFTVIRLRYRHFTEQS